MKIHLVTLSVALFHFLAQVSHADLIDDKLPKGDSEIVVNPERDATTTIFVEATRNGKNPIGLLTSTADTFINDGTTTEYMTQHMGTYIDEKYAKIESTSTREYYYVKETQGATGLIGASSDFEVHGGKTTEVTVHEYRTYIDGSYAHLVSSKLNIYSNPSSYISATPIYNPGLPSSAYTLFPREYVEIDPSKPESGLPTRTIGEYPIKKKFDDNIIESHEIEADLYAIRPRSIDDFELKINADSVIYEDPTIPTFTVSGDGELEIPVIEEASLIENEVEPESLNRDHSMLKPSRTILDSVTYIGFVDFTTTIDDTVVIFKPKKTYNTVSKSLIMHKIIPTQSVSLESEPFRRKEAIIVDKKIIEHDVIPTSHVNVHLNNVNEHNANADIHQNNVNKLQNNVNVQQNSVNVNKNNVNIHDNSVNVLKKNRIVPTPTLDSSLQERHRTSEPDIIASSPSIPKITSGINPLKKLLAASASRRNKFNKFTPSSTNKASTISSTEAPSNSVKGDSETSNKKETSNRFNLNGRPKVNLRPGLKTSSPPSISSSIDTDSDVELVYKTLYTTYTYFTTFFRASTTRIKSREDIVSNVVTLTNILRPSDLESLKNSCEVDSTCVFATSGPVTKSKGFIGRPNESKREENARRIDSSPINKSVDQEEGSLLKTFYTTYTYFTTLFLEGTSSVSTRTEVYSNIKSSGVPIDTLNKDNDVTKTSVAFQSTASKRLDEVDFTSSSASSRKLEYSSIERGTTTTESPEEQESTISSTLSSVEDLTTINITPSATLKGGSEESEVTTDSQIEESNLTPTPELESAITTPEPLSTEPVVKTYYTTFTYFTTLFRNGTSTVTSNLETITNVGTSSPTLSSSFTPSVTFFTTFTYWTTLIDGDKTITSSSEETRTDILPASVTQDITLPEEKVLFTASPNLPSIDSTSEESKKDSDKETESKKSSKSNRTFTPAIRPNLIRPLGRPVSRPRDPPSRTTVAIITRSDVTPTLIATPVTSPIQPTPTFEEDLKSVSISSEGTLQQDEEEDKNEETSTEASTKSNSLIRPTILSGVRLRRPNPFRERLRERQRQHLNKVRGNSPGVEETQEEEEDLEPQTTPAPRRRARPSFSERRERNKIAKPPRFSFPRGSNGRAPIFVSSRTERFDRRKNSQKQQEDKSEEEIELVSETTPSFTTERNPSTVPNHISKLRERARARINSLFSRRSRPSNRFNIFSSRTKDNEESNDDSSTLEEKTDASLSRKKRQVSHEFGSRTRNRQTFVLRRRLRNKPQPANPNADDSFSRDSLSNSFSYSSTSNHSSNPSLNRPSFFDNNHYDLYSSNFNQDPLTNSATSNTSKRQVRQQNGEGFKPRSSSRFSSRARQRLRSRNNNNNKPDNTNFQSSRFGSSSRSEPKKSFRDRFRPKTRGNGGFRRTTPRPFKNNFDYEYDNTPELESSQQQNSVPDFITVTHFIPLQTTIPVKERGINTFRDILTTSPSLEVVAANSLKSTEVNNSPVIYANAITNTPRAGVKEITYQALRATETTQVVFTPTRIRGIRTSFSHVVPSTIYNIQPVSTKIVEQVNQNDLLSTLLLQLLGGAVNKSPNPLLGAQQPQIANLLGRNNAPATQFITHTSTYVTTVSKLDSTIVTITLRGREIKTTLTESQTEVVTATELSTETIIRATPAGANGLGGGFLQTQSPLGSGLNNLPGLGLPDLKQQLLAAQLQQQLLAQQKQLQQQQQALLSEKLALEQLKHKVGKSFPSIDGSKDDKLIMAASSQSEDRVQKIVRVEVNSKVEVNPAPSKKKKREAAMDDNPLPLSHPLHPSPVIQIFPIEPTPFSGSPQI
ncbi:uncharacterized protein [Lepeophtheirus salmonis]|uniref:uncharacterized protein n=1 Tax=Lepeophtheirus salmonis TaxID=72036 RepID=UPI003AF3F9E6